MLAKWRVPLGYVLGAAALVLARPQPVLLGLGIALVCLGEALRVWAAGHLVKGGSSLTRSGPYGLTRNPLYLGSLGVGLGFALATSHPLTPVAFLLFFLAVYVPVMRIEARRMREVHPVAYGAFEREVPLFFPRLTPSPGRDRRAFSFRQALLNREQWTVLGCLAGTLLLWWKMG